MDDPQGHTLPGDSRLVAASGGPILGLRPGRDGESPLMIKEEKTLRNCYFVPHHSPVAAGDRDTQERSPPCVDMCEFKSDRSRFNLIGIQSQGRYEGRTVSASKYLE